MSGDEQQPQVLALLYDIRERVARIEAGNAERCKARGDAIEALEECRDDHEKRLHTLETHKVIAESHEDRLRKLEEHKAITKGQATALTAVGTAVGAAAGALIPRFLGGGQ